MSFAVREATMAKFIAFVGRFLFVLVFLGAAVDKVMNYNKETGGPLMAEMAPKLDNFFYKLRAQGIEVPSLQQYYPQVLLAAAVFELLGSVLMVLNIKFGACLLMTFLLGATVVMHNFWDLDPATAEYTNQMINFLKNLSLFGACLFFVSIPAAEAADSKQKRD